MNKIFSERPFLWNFIASQLTESLDTRVGFSGPGNSKAVCRIVSESAYVPFWGAESPAFISFSKRTVKREANLCTTTLHSY